MLTIPRVPAASESNLKEFCNKWVACYGGTISNAYRVWRVELHANAKKCLTLSNTELQKLLSI